MKKISTVFIYHLRLFLISALLLGFCNEVNIAQMSNYILSVKTGDAKDKSPLIITADLISLENISSLNVAFKSFGQNEFQKIEMMVAGTTASVTIPGDNIQPPYLEYYLIIDLKDGTSQTYPLDVDQGVSPIQIAVSGVSEKDSEIIVLSPNEGEVISKDDFLISISFIKAPSKVDIAKTKIFLDNQDITSQELLAGDLIIINSENLSEIQTGGKSLKIEIYDSDGNLYHTINKSFQVATQLIADEAAAAWKYFSNLRAESRNENFNKASTWYNNFNVDAGASYKDWKFNGYLYVTSEEKNNLQPYNRYLAAVSYIDLLDIKVGDSYPRFPNLIMDGKRVRGFSGSLNFGFFNLQTSIGETDRKIEGKLLQTYSKEQVPLGSNIIAINEAKYNDPYGAVNFGTYKRDLFAIRPSFGSGEKFQFGLTYLHSKDDPGSIEFGARPEENALFGTDLMFALDDQNIIFTSQAAVSLVNTDISGGELSDAQIDSLFGPDKYFDMNPDDVKTIRDLVGNFITINQYIGPLNPQKFSSLAGEGAVTFNYFNNSLKASYIYRGNDYQSFGQSFIRTDVKGINLVDRIRMLDNKLFISLGYESLKDNLQSTKIATTTYKTFSASVSVFPRADFPNITLGYNRYDNENGLSVKKTDNDQIDTLNSKYVVDDATNRFLITLSYDIIAGVRHSSSLSFSTQNRDDNGMYDADAKFNSGILSVNSYWTMALNSIFQIIYSSTDITGMSKFDYFTLVAGAKYRMLENKLLLSATLSPSFGDFDRQAFEFTASYNVLANFDLVFQARIFRFPGKVTNSIIGLTTRLTL